MIGKGVAQPGARLLSHRAWPGAKPLLHGPASSERPSKRQHKAVTLEKGVAQAQFMPQRRHSQAVPVKDTRSHMSVLDTTAEVIGSRSLGAAPAAALSQSVFDANELDLPSDTEDEIDLGEHRQNQAQSVTGVVTSGACRGVSSNKAALALCSLAALQQKQKRQQQALSRYTLDSVAMQMHHPASTAIHDVLVHTVHA